MADNNSSQTRLPLDKYPKSIPFIRWFLLTLEGGLAIYFTLSFRMELGILFLAYGIACLFLVFPLIRCVRCAYYGKRCNFGWGKFWVSNVFPKSEDEHFGAYHGWSILLWPIRLIPIGLGLRNLPLWIFGKFSFMQNGLFLIYLAILFIHRKFYRAQACSRCQQQKVCPVYTGRTGALEVIK